MRLTLLLVAALAGPTPTWTEVAVQDGVRVEQRDDPESPLPRFRATGVLAASLPAVARVVADGDRHHEWMHNTRESRILDRRGRRFHVYQRLFSPPPVADRDVVLVVTRHEERDVCRFRFRAVEHDAAPPVDRVVRMHKLEGQFVLRRVGPRRTEVTYEVLADPGGQLPPWMARRGLRDMPLRTLLNLRARVEKRGKARPPA